MVRPILESIHQENLGGEKFEAYVDPGFSLSHPLPQHTYMILRITAALDKSSNILFVTFCNNCDMLLIHCQGWLCSGLINNKLFDSS